MKFVIDEKVIREKKLTNAQFFLLLSLYCPITFDEFEDLRTNMFYITQPKNIQAATITPDGVRLVEEVIKGKQPKRNFEELAATLRTLFPQGKKAGTNTYWRGNIKEVVDKLSNFSARFGQFEDHIIIEATQKYISAYQDNTKLMRALPYFIMKNTDDGLKSDLLTYIENLDSTDSDILNTMKLL
jgi:hypothetical protein